MNNLYRKIAVASVCTALGFGLGANKEVKATSFTFAPTITSEIIDGQFNGHIYDGQGDVFTLKTYSLAVARGTSGEVATLTEFNTGSFSFAPNTVISSAVLQVEILSFSLTGLGINKRTNPGSLGIFGYVGNGTVEASDFEAGVFLNSVDVSSSSLGDLLNFNVTPFINQRASNGDAFAGFGIRALNFGGLFLNNSNFSGIKPRLIVETTDIAEPVPEPTTIFGSALALSLGGWLKRKKSSQKNKIAPQR